MISVEVAPECHHDHEVQGYFTHTNHYFGRHDQEQEITLSSRKPLERSLTLGRATNYGEAGRVLALLSNQTDRDYPIYRDATPPDVDATLCTALYDLDNRKLRVYFDHPVKEPGKYVKLSL